MDNVDYLFITLIITAALGCSGLGLTLLQYWRSKKRTENTVSKKTIDLQQPTSTQPINTNTVITNSLSARVEPTLNNTTLSSLGFDSLESILTKPCVSPEKSKISTVSPELNKLEKSTSVKEFTTNDSKEFAILYAVAPPNRPYRGYELLQALADANLHYGVMNIFHYYCSKNGNKEIIFSVASAAEPGTFDLTNMGAISCPGLCFFISLAKTSYPEENFHLMLNTAQTFIEALGGTLCDENRQTLDAYNIVSS